MKQLLLAKEEYLQEIYELVQKTVRDIYPTYYLTEIVDMFSEYHSKERIEKDIREGKTYCIFSEDKIVATGTLCENHINRVYVLTEYQKNGYGTFIMTEFEKMLAESYDRVSIDASLPACCLYEKLGYKTITHGKWECKNGVIQVYEIMEKQLREAAINNENIKLRPYKAIDGAIIAGWVKDEKTLRMWSSDRFGDYPVTAEDINYKYLECNGDCAEPDNFYPLTAVCDGKIVGHLILRYTAPDTIRFGFVIVDDSLRGKGYGKKMLLLAKEYAFSMLGAKRLTLGVFDNNPGAYYCYKAAGFKEIEEAERFSLELFNETWTVIEMEITAE